MRQRRTHTARPVRHIIPAPARVSAENIARPVENAPQKPTEEKRKPSSVAMYEYEIIIILSTLHNPMEFFLLVESLLTFLSSFGLAMAVCGDFFICGDNCK
jgi:hypothetical protein